VSAEADQVAHCWPLGHFYSPVPDTVELAREPARSRVWPAEARPLPGVDWRAAEQVALLRELGGLPQLDLPRAATHDPAEYHTANGFFALTDGWVLQAMLRRVRPRRLIEVGGGWSSLLTARVNRECLDGALDFTSVEPYPPEFLAPELPGLTRLLVLPVQDVPLERFLALEAGDVLLIDSSHVIKTGNDVRYLYHEVMPRLAPGVLVHVHDVFLPDEYPEDWVLSGRGWNEQYLLQSFLAFNPAFEVLLANWWLGAAHHDEVAACIPGYRGVPEERGGSLWMRRVR
jgi:hypothetical protein